MLTLAAAAALGWAPSASLLTPRRTATATRLMMSTAGSTETLDFTAGGLREQKDLTDSDLYDMGRRARPDIDWSNLRTRLGAEFGFEDAELSKYDTVSKEDLLKVQPTLTYFLSAAPNPPLPRRRRRAGDAVRTACVGGARWSPADLSCEGGAAAHRRACL